MATGLQVEASYRQIIKLALPISFAMLIPQINFVTTNIFLGHYNQQSLAIAGITGVYYLIFAMIGFGLNNGLQALIARRAGENRPEEIGKIFSQGIYIAISIAVIGIIVTWFVSPIILKKVLHEKGAADIAVRFLKIRIWGLFFLYIYQMRNALVSRVPIKASILYMEPLQRRSPTSFLITVLFSVILVFPSLD